MKAGRTKILFYQAKKQAEENNQIMLPIGLPFFETIEEVIKEINLVYQKYLTGTIILSAGSGTILTGIILGLKQMNILPNKIIAITPGMSIQKLDSRIHQRINEFMDMYNLFFPVQFSPILNKLFLYKSEREYYEQIPMNTPFPSNSYYEGRAWEYLINNINNITPPILFWNIGT
jgi:hypothetical protein